MRPFDDTTRRNIADLCAAFSRVAPGEAAADLKRAAVAIALVADARGDTTFLLTRRAAGLRAHRAQWALPGGRCDAGETQAQAALRELREELGLALSEDAVLGLLDDYPTRSGYLITPVVVWAASDQEISINTSEVAAVHAIGLDLIERADAFDFTAIPESTRRVIRFHYEGRLIHAPTAAMIYQFREVLASRATRVAELEQPVFAWK
jgi:8-oxo-dGTP pyrophosphatase MutT (NUDIX family)